MGLDDEVARLREATAAERRREEAQQSEEAEGVRAARTAANKSFRDAAALLMRLSAPTSTIYPRHVDKYQRDGTGGLVGRGLRQSRGWLLCPGTGMGFALRTDGTTVPAHPVMNGNLCSCGRGDNSSRIDLSLSSDGAICIDAGWNETRPFEPWLAKEVARLIDG